ncbi:MAG: hypothetical protein ISS14_03965 [Actinobacteria bacterium]|nr:hypothetical protein [Actinomycetota bacterium]
MDKINFFKIIITLILSLFVILFLPACDQSILDIYTEVNSNYSGTRVIDISVKKEYIQKGGVVLSDSQSLYDKILDILPEGEIETYDREDYSHFKSTITFNDINFLQHISIDNFSETPPERFYAKMEKEDYFFQTEYFFYDYVDMKIDDMLLSATDKNDDFVRFDNLYKTDSNIISITYQVKFPVEIMKTNADILGENNIAIWIMKYGEQKDIYIEGKKTKFLSYFLLAILGLIGLFAMFLIFVLLFSSRRRKKGSSTIEPISSYDNYFKKDKYFNNIDDD